MESTLDTMQWPTETEAQLRQMNDALVQQGEALQDVGRTFSQTVGNDSDAAVSPLLVQAMEHVKVVSLGSLHLLAAQAEVLSVSDRPAFINVMMAFLEHCDWQQVAVAPKYLGKVCHKFSQACITDGRAAEGLLPLRTAARRMQSNSSSLNPVYPEFLQCCIVAKCYSVGVRFLNEHPVFGVDPKATGLTPVQFLRHLYYSGVVYVGTKRWKEALDSFLMLITAPANFLSSLVVEGYKKMVLVSLLISGRMPTLPKYASPVVTRHLKAHIMEYELLGARSQAGDIKGLGAAVLGGAEVFKQALAARTTHCRSLLKATASKPEDGNTGLVKQVAHALTRRKIMQLTHTYITLSLKDISNKVDLEDPSDSEVHILQMVEAGDINAKMELPAGTVHFQEDLDIFTSTLMTSRLEIDLQSTADLTDRVRKLEARLMTNPVFIQKMSGDHSIQAGLGGTFGHWDEIGMGD